MLSAEGKDHFCIGAHTASRAGSLPKRFQQHGPGFHLPPMAVGHCTLLPSASTSLKTVAIFLGSQGVQLPRHLKGRLQTVRGRCPESGVIFKQNSQAFCLRRFSKPKRAHSTVEVTQGKVAALPQSSSRPLWNATVSNWTLSHKAINLGILPPSAINRMWGYPPPEMTGSGIALGAVCKCLEATWLWGDLLCGRSGLLDAGRLQLPDRPHLVPKFDPPEVFLAMLWKLTSEKWQKPKSNVRAWGKQGEWEERSSSTLTSAAHCHHHLSRQLRHPEERCQGGNGAEACAHLLQLFVVFFFFLPPIQESVIKKFINCQ